MPRDQIRQSKHILGVSMPRDQIRRGKNIVGVTMPRIPRTTCMRTHGMKNSNQILHGNQNR